MTEIKIWLKDWFRKGLGNCCVNFRAFHLDGRYCLVGVPLPRFSLKYVSFWIQKDHILRIPHSGTSGRGHKIVKLIGMKWPQLGHLCLDLEVKVLKIKVTPTNRAMAISKHDRVDELLKLLKSILGLFVKRRKRTFEALSRNGLVQVLREGYVPDSYHRIVRNADFSSELVR